MNVNTLPPEEQYDLPKSARRLLRRWRSNLLNEDDFYTPAEVNVLALEVIADHNYSALRGDIHTPSHKYRLEQVLFAQTLPSEEYEALDGFSAVRAVTVERKIDEPAIQVDG